MKIIQKLLPSRSARKQIPPLLFDSPAALKSLKAYNDSATGGSSSSELSFEGCLRVKGEVVVDQESSMLQNGVYSGLAWQKMLSLQDSYDTLQLEIKTDGKRYTVECQQEYDNFVVAWQAFIVDQTRNFVTLELPLQLFSVSKNKRSPQLAYSSIGVKEIHQIDFAGVYLYCREPGPFQLQLRRMEFVRRGENVMRLIRNYRRPIFLHAPDYQNLSILSTGKQILELTK